MKGKSRFTRSAICLAQTVLLLAGNVSVAFAATAAGNSSLDTFEKSIFGEIHSKQSESSRLKDLEINLFGKVHSGSTASRITEISKALGGAANDNLLLPAMAPQLDTSSGNVVHSAPSSSRDNYSSDDSPITASGDAEKETLRNAMRLYTQGKTDEAEKQFRKALTINKNSADAYYNLGVIAEGKGDLQGALNSYRSAARINPSDTDLASAISSLETRLQDKANADQRQRQVQQQAALEQQEQRKTDNLKQMIATAATAYKNRDYDKAISNLQYVSQQAPNDGDVAYALGQAYKGKGDYSHARTAYSNAIASDPGNSLYKDALANLNQVANSSNSSGSSSDGFPAAAPDRKRNRPGQLTGFSGGGTSGSGNTGYTSASNDAGSNYGGGGSSAGQLTPFSGVTNGSSTGDDEFSNLTAGGIGPQQGFISSSSSGRSFGISGLGGGLGSLGSITSLLGAGGMGSMMGGGVRYNGYSSGSYGGGRYGGTSTRIKRVAIGGLGGAAAGAMYGQMGGRGSVKSSAMKGALMGAAMGLFMGGF